MSSKKIQLDLKNKNDEFYGDSDDEDIPPPPPPDEKNSDNQKFQPVTPETPPVKNDDKEIDLIDKDDEEYPGSPKGTPPDVQIERAVKQKEEEEKKKEIIEKKKRVEANKKRDIFIPIVGEANLTFQLKNIGRKLKENILKNLSKKFEGRCNSDGFIKTDSIKIINYSSGLLVDGNVTFKIVYEALVCNPVQGHKIDCKVHNVTKAGIRAEVKDGDDTPLVIFIARDHHYNNPYFLSVKEGDSISVRVVGSRFELNDTYIAIIGELVKPKSKPKLKIKK
jgi:DNA-directed RNA polymerase subunit E'/Rpb7